MGALLVPAIHCHSFFMYFLFIFFPFISFLGNTVLQLHTNVVTYSYSIAGTVIVCHFARSLVAFVCQEI